MLKPFLLLFIIGITACQPSTEKRTGSTSSADLSLKYATGFSAQKQGDSWHVTIHTPYQGASQPMEYLLVPRSASSIPAHSDAQVIRIPVRRMICTSTTHVPLLDYLGETDALVGFPTPDYISSLPMRRRIDNGEVVNVGIDNGMSLEKVLALEPDMIMSYSLSADMGQMKQLRQAGLPVLINSEYLEKHPLGRSEWIKLAGLLFGKQEQADSVFRSIEEKYLSFRKLVARQTNEPTVMSGVLYGDTWYLPGGKNYASTMFEDAGLDYLWIDNDQSGFLELSFESVLEKAVNADFWIGVASFTSLENLKEADERYARFKPFQQGQVFTYDARKGATGGSEYLELGYLRPDLILGDLIRIGHPEALPDRQMYFFARLP